MADGAIQQDVRSVAPRRPAAPGITIPRLTFAEQLVLWSARRLATAGHGAAATETDASACRHDVRARVGGELSVALYPTGGPAAGVEAAEALERALDIFGCAGVRSLRLNPMCCRFVSNDERLFLSFLASCQEGDHRHAAALLSWFLPPAGVRSAAAEWRRVRKGAARRRVPAAAAAHADRERGFPHECIGGKRPRRTRCTSPHAFVYAAPRGQGVRARVNPSQRQGSRRHEANHRRRYSPLCPCHAAGGSARRGRSLCGLSGYREGI